MLQNIVCEKTGKILLGHNTITGEIRDINISRLFRFNPLANNMALVHPDLQGGSSRISLVDAENTWFLRTDNITGYGCEPELEKTTINAKKPLLFFNFQTNPGATGLICNHTKDEPGKSCPNPRIGVPGNIFHGVISKLVKIDVRSFGVRTPLCSAENPSFGIFRLFHILPPTLAWLWRLVSPRGHANHSIVSSEYSGMESEGVGSFRPFATGKMINHANLLLEQSGSKSPTSHVLTPNQFMGVWKVGFRPQLLMRE